VPTTLSYDLLLVGFGGGTATETEPNGFSLATATNDCKQVCIEQLVVSQI
jgi:hypothetical protein